MTADTMAPEFVTNEECQELAEQMMKKYRIALKERAFSVRASLQGRGVHVTVLLANPEQTYYYPVEARMLFAPEEMQPKEAALFLIDYIDNYFEEYLLEEDEELFLPIDWSDHEYEAVNFQVKGQILNRKLEALADEWLKEKEPEERV
jgi:hypothetical protein